MLNVNLIAQRRTENDLVLSYTVHQNHEQKLADVNYIVPLGLNTGRTAQLMICGAGHWHFEGCNADDFLERVKRAIQNDFCVRAKDLVLH